MQRPHQLIGLEWALALWASGSNGILAGECHVQVAPHNAVDVQHRLLHRGSTSCDKTFKFNIPTQMTWDL